MKKLLTVFLCSFFLFGTVAVCGAVGFTLQRFDVSESSLDPGLVIQTAEILPEPTYFELNNTGDSATFDLFRIWTDENTVNAPEDTVHHPISVAMYFSAIADTVEGETFGYRNGGITGGRYQGGSLRWIGPLDISFGSDVFLNVALTDRDFNQGILGVREGSRNGAIVQATFTYGAASASAPVPEPSTILLMGAGLLGLVAVGRRKFNRKE